MFTIEVQSDRIQKALRDIGNAVQNMSPVMRAIGLELIAETEDNFSNQGRPHWMGLAPSTIKQRAKHGTWPGMILQRSAGGLAASIMSFHDSNSVSVGVGGHIKYGAIHQFGGKAGRGHQSTIPARPFLPIDKQGNLTDSAEEAVMSIVSHYLRSVIT